MYNCYIMFRSLTAAQRGLTVCQGAGIPARLTRTPVQASALGCSYALEISKTMLYRAAMELRLNNIQYSRVLCGSAFHWEEADV